VEALTPAERRGAAILLCLLALGAGRDLWRATRPLPAPAPVASRDAVVRPVPPDDGLETDSLASAGGRATPHGSPTIDLNSASPSDLDALPGIGPVLAERIVSHRRRHGPFGSPEELLAVRGIGPRLLARLAPHVRVGGSSTVARPESLGRGR
jgi:competence ComEA-like helix-hairpin-helix protein